MKNYKPILGWLLVPVFCVLCGMVLLTAFWPRVSGRIMRCIERLDEWNRNLSR